MFDKIKKNNKGGEKTAGKLHHKVASILLELSVPNRSVTLTFEWLASIRSKLVGFHVPMESTKVQCPWSG